MAITTAAPRIKTQVLVDGAALEEYEDDEEHTEPNSVTKYVEAKSGAEFAIRSRFTEQPQYDILTRILLDGKYVMGQLAILKYFHGDFLEQTAHGVRSNKGGQWVLSKFAFSDLKTVDSAGRLAGDQLMKDLKGMGQISVRFHYITNLRTSTKPLERSEKAGLGEIPEKALKGRALSHQSTLRAPTPTKAVETMESDYVDPAGKPFASINFKYRSREAMKSLLIIQRSPSPVPLEDRDVDSLSPQEMRELLRRQRERGEAARAIKREGGVKRECSRERSSTANGATRDDDDGEVSFVSAKRRRFPVTINEEGVETVDLTQF